MLSHAPAPSSVFRDLDTGTGAQVLSQQGGHICEVQFVPLGAKSEGPNRFYFVPAALEGIMFYPYGASFIMPSVPPARLKCEVVLRLSLCLRCLLRVRKSTAEP